MNNKDSGRIRNVLLGLAGVLMIIGVALGQYSVGIKLIMIGLIVSFIFSRFEINRLRKIIKSFEIKTQRKD